MQSEQTAPAVIVMPERTAGLSLNAAGSISAGKRGDFRCAHQVEVMLDAVLEAGCRNGKVDGCLVIVTVHQRVDEPAAETVSAADAV